MRRDIGYRNTAGISDLGTSYTLDRYVAGTLMNGVGEGMVFPHADSKLHGRDQHHGAGYAREDKLHHDAAPPPVGFRAKVCVCSGGAGASACRARLAGVSFAAPNRHFRAATVRERLPPHVMLRSLILTTLVMVYWLFNRPGSGMSWMVW